MGDLDDILAMSGAFDGDDGSGEDPGVGFSMPGASQLMNLASRSPAARALLATVRPQGGRPARASGPKFYLPQPPRQLPPAPNQSSQALQNMFLQASEVPGVRLGGPSGRIEQLGGTPAFFTFGPATAQIATIQLVPFKAVKPVRLMVDISIVGAPGCIVLLSNASIGDRNQLAGAAGVPATSYGPTATLTRLSWDVIIPSVPLVLTFATTAAPAAATSITVAPMLYCMTLS